MVPGEAEMSVDGEDPAAPALRSWAAALWDVGGAERSGTALTLDGLLDKSMESSIVLIELEKLEPTCAASAETDEAV